MVKAQDIISGSRALNSGQLEILLIMVAKNRALIKEVRELKKALKRATVNKGTKSEHDEYWQLATLPTW